MMVIPYVSVYDWRSWFWQTNTNFTNDEPQYVQYCANNNPVGDWSWCRRRSDTSNCVALLTTDSTWSCSVAVHLLERCKCQPAVAESRTLVLLLSMPTCAVVPPRPLFKYGQRYVFVGFALRVNQFVIVRAFTPPFWWTISTSKMPVQNRSKTCK